MATAIINGLRPIGALGHEYFGKGAEDFVMTLYAGNSVVQRGALPMLSFFESVTKTVERVPGQSIPVETFNVYFTEGGFTSNGYGFDKYTEKFDLQREKGLTAVTYDYTTEEILKAREAKVDLMKKITEQVQAYVNVYTDMVLPYRMVQTLITGSSLNTEVVAEGDGQAYTRAFGWLRGEEVGDYIKPHQVGISTKRNHFRGTKGVSFALTDVYECVDLLSSYKDASPLKPYALANARTIQNTVGASLEYQANVDEVMVFGEMGSMKYRTALGCNWVDMNSYLPEGVILFLDASAKDIIVKAISPDVEQRGIAFVKHFGGELHKLESAEDFIGGSVKVFPEELFICKRHLGVILDTANKGQQSSDHKKGWAEQSTTITKLQNYAKALRASYLAPMK